MSDVKQVKVDNWGIYFLQKLKNFFNRTDYCDLTLQFQDNAQLKVHRLVLSACTEYFEVLERTCEMYEDCLVMPDDLQADVVVPIVNFMYTGHLEFKMELLERLYQTSQILNMPVLSKLLESHRCQNLKSTPIHSYGGKRFNKSNSEPKTPKPSTPPSTSQKRSYSKAFQNVVYKQKRNYSPGSSDDRTETLININSPFSAAALNPVTPMKPPTIEDSRPTRYELPEELDTDNVFDSSFSNISYTSQPLMVHPETMKRYSNKKSEQGSEASNSKKLSELSTVDIVECKRISNEDNIFEDNTPDHTMNEDTDIFLGPFGEPAPKDTSQLFDQILDPTDGPKVTIETKDSKTASNLDHAKIISEVLKKYPHLVKSNKSIKLKILDPTPSKNKKQPKMSNNISWAEEKPIKMKTEEEADYTYETDVIDSKQAAKLIAMGAENTRGPWICLICGTPGKALHFPSYYKFRRHLVEVHNEKPVSNICEYCGLRSLKRNYLLHHLYAQHGVPPPPQYNFPKCNLCSYIALTPSLLVKHKMSHKDSKNFRCNVCTASFVSSSQLLTHIQNTGHKYSDRKNSNLQCIYCLRVFLREANLYAHIKTHHKKEANDDGIIDDSDEEQIAPPVKEKPKTKILPIKYEPSTSFDYEEADRQFLEPVIEEIPIVTRKPVTPTYSSKQKILNPGFGTPKSAKAKVNKNAKPAPIQQNAFSQEIDIQIPSFSQDEDEVVVIDNKEYIMKNNQLIPRKRKPNSNEYVVQDVLTPALIQSNQHPTTSVQYPRTNNVNIDENSQEQANMLAKKTANLNQQIQIVVSNEEEYKALMASNHPILFEDGDASKTLTVLTTQQNPTMQTIDLGNNHSNEMMIIPDEFPMNVSEAVASENQNIVVVYSHPVDDQNKQQYQILTSGGIEAQFVQSSAIITQNYETVTTSTTGVSTHCLQAQVNQAWQSSMQTVENQHMHIPAEIKNIQSDQIEIKPVHIAHVNNFEELPEVHLGPGPQPPHSEPRIVSNELLHSNMDQVNQQMHQVVQESEETCEGHINSTISNQILIQNNAISTTTSAEATTHQLTPDFMSTTQIISVVGDQQIESQNIVTQQQLQPENTLEEPAPTNIIEHTEQHIEQDLETGVSIEQQHTASENVEKPHIGSESVEQQNIITSESIEQQNHEMAVIEQHNESEVIDQQHIESEGAHEQFESEEVGEEEQQVLPEDIIEQQSVREDLEQQMQHESTILEQMETDDTLEQPLESENIIHQQMEPEDILEQPKEIETEMEQTMETEIEQPMETEDVTEQATTDMVVVQAVDTENTLEQPVSSENVLLEQTNSLPDENVIDSNIVDPSENHQVPESEHIETSNNPVLDDNIASQAYDDIEEINHDNVVDAGEKIQNLTSEWSEDEYDVPEDESSTVIEKTSNEDPQKEISESENPEVEESIENIQEEVKKHMVTPVEAEDNDTEESAASSHDDVSSQEMHLTPMNDSPIPVGEPNPQAQQKISSLLNDWDDNDTQGESLPDNASEETDDPADTVKDGTETEAPKPDDNIKSLVSDWDEEEEEPKE